MKYRTVHTWDYFQDKMRFFVWELDGGGCENHIIASGDTQEDAEARATEILKQKKETTVVREFEI